MICNMLEANVQIHEGGQNAIQVLGITVDQFPEETLHSKTLIAGFGNMQGKPATFLFIWNGSKSLLYGFYGHRARAHSSHAHPPGAADLISMRYSQLDHPMSIADLRTWRFDTLLFERANEVLYLLLGPTVLLKVSD